MAMNLRPAIPADVPQISAFLTRLTELGIRTRPSDEDFVLNYYVNGQQNIQCTVAEEDGTILGFQCLQTAAEGNEFGVTPGWGIIGTHVNPDTARRGVGRALFPATLQAAQEAGLTDIDASIGADNPGGLGYYEAMGFRTYRTPAGKICKRYQL